jgi:hypothetical protein
VEKENIDKGNKRFLWDKVGIAQRERRKYITIFMHWGSISNENRQQQTNNEQMTSNGHDPILSSHRKREISEHVSHSHTSLDDGVIFN